MKKETTIVLAEKKITLRKLSIRELLDVIREIKELPDNLVSLDKKDNDAILRELPMIIADSLPLFAKVLVKASNSEEITEDFLLKNCGLDDIIELVVQLLELNNASGIFKNIKKIQALRQAPAK